VERTSLPAFSLLCQAWPRTWRKRQWIQQHRRVGDRELARWFRFQPVSFPAPELNSKPASLSTQFRTHNS